MPNIVTTDAAGRRFDYHRDVVHGATIFAAGPDPAEVARLAAAVGRRANMIVLGGGGHCAEGRVLPDEDEVVRKALFPDFGDAGEAILADAGQRLVERVPLDQAGTARLLAALDGMTRPPPRERRETAPVMLLTNLVEPDLRRRLIEAFAADNREGTVAILDADGKPTKAQLSDRKRRRDLTLDSGGPLYAEIRSALAARLMPELWKAWWIDRLRPEAFYVACYQAERGDFFSAHRDNNLPSTAHRRIAVSIELNDDYEGGGLVFPEYSDDRWRAPAGGGLVFSCSLMHEAVPVTAGKRYVLLVFLAAPT